MTSAGLVPTLIHSKQHKSNKLSNSSSELIISNLLIHVFLNFVALFSLSPSLTCSIVERVETNESSDSCSLDGRSVDVSSDSKLESDPLSCESEFKLESPDVGGEEGGDSLLVVIAGGGDDTTKVGGGVTIGEDSTYDKTLADIELLLLKLFERSFSLMLLFRAIRRAIGVLDNFSSKKALILRESLLVGVLVILLLKNGESATLGVVESLLVTTVGLDALLIFWSGDSSRGIPSLLVGR